MGFSQSRTHSQRTLGEILVQSTRDSTRRYWPSSIAVPQLYTEAVLLQHFSEVVPRGLQLYLSHSTDARASSGPASWFHVHRIVTSVPSCTIANLSSTEMLKWFLKWWTQWRKIIDSFQSAAVPLMELKHRHDQNWWTFLQPWDRHRSQRCELCLW